MVKYIPNIKWSFWQKRLAEGALIVGSVYLAIVLESLSDERGRAEDARAGLVQLQAELVADRSDLRSILVDQQELNIAQQNLQKWLASPATMPNESVHLALEILTSNSTMFPRRGAWTSLISGGQLTSVGNDALVTRLANLYENLYVRLEYNGRDYDYNLNEVNRVTVSAVWDQVNRQPFGDMVKLRNELLFIEVGWTRFYLSLLEDYEIELDEVLSDLEAHLKNSGSGD